MGSKRGSGLFLCPAGRGVEVRGSAFGSSERRGLGFGVWGLGFRVLGFGVWGFGFWGFGVLGFGF